MFKQGSKDHPPPHSLILLLLSLLQPSHPQLSRDHPLPIRSPPPPNPLTITPNPTICTVVRRRRVRARSSGQVRRGKLMNQTTSRLLLGYKRSCFYKMVHAAIVIVVIIDQTYIIKQDVIMIPFLLSSPSSPLSLILLRSTYKY